MSLEYIQEVEVEKFNPYHDRRGRFTTAGNAASFTIRTKGGAYQRNLTNRAIEREKKRMNTPAMTEQNFLDSRGVGDPLTDWINDKTVIPRGLTARQQKVHDENGRKEAEKLYNARQAARKEYKEKVKNGELRDKSQMQRTIERAIYGHEDLAATHAARRMLEKRYGLDWKKLKAQAEKESSTKKSVFDGEYIDEPASFDILKSDDDKHLVFGWASIAQTADGEMVEDIQKDIIEPEDLEDAAYEYVLNFRDTGEEHLAGYRKKGKLIESCVFTEEKQRAMGLAPGSLPVGWWIGFHIEDEDAWRRIKDGTYRMFSIEGKAERVPVEKKAPTGCGVIVLNDDGEVLTGKRTKENVIGGPGGHIEEGETPEEAAIRETYEEFGIVCRDLQPLGVLDGGEKYGDSAIFLCEDYFGRVKTDQKEMTEPQWLSIEDLEDKYLFLPFAQSIDLYRESKVEKFNPYHDRLGRFTTSGNANSFTIRTKGGAYQQNLTSRAIEREKERTKSGGDGGPVKLTKENEAYLREYTAGKYHNACSISQEIVETGGCKKYKKSIESDFSDNRKESLAKDIEQTKQLMAVIDGQPIKNDELVRVEAGHASLKPGDTVTWGIRSVSRNLDFGDKVRDQKDDGSESKAYFDGDYIGLTEYRITGPKKALDIDMYSDFDQKESLVKGKFRVKSIKKEKYIPPKAPKTLGERMKDEPELAERFTVFTSKKGREMIKDNKTGKIHEKNILNKVLNDDDTFGYADASMSSTPPPSFKPKTIVELEQIL